MSRRHLSRPHPDSSARRLLALSVLLASAGMSALLPGQSDLQVTERLSVDSAGAEGNAGGRHPSVSADGRFVAFESDSTNLVPGDSNGKTDVFVVDRQLGTIQRVSIDSAGGQGNGDSHLPAISADGTRVVFESPASNLVGGDTNGLQDVFVHDRLTGQTRRVSVDSSGGQANDHSYDARISGDGAVVVFWSFATNLDPPDGTPYFGDVFTHDLVSGITTMESVDSSGVQGNRQSGDPSISFDGSLLAFESFASNLVPGDTNNQVDIFVRNRVLGTTERVSLSASGAQAISYSREAAIAADGSAVAFWSWASNLVSGDFNLETDIFVRDLVLGTTERVSVDSYGAEGNEESYAPSISEDGRFVAFRTLSSNLVPGDANQSEDVFVRDRMRGFTHRVSLASDGTEADADAIDPEICADGRFVVFESSATTLVVGDSNHAVDVFLHDRRSGGPEIESRNLVAGSTGTLTVTGATPGGAVVIGYSLVGQAAFGSPWGILHLAASYQQRTLFADGQGIIHRSFPLASSLAGSPLWFQGVDVVTRYPTSVAPGRVQ